MGAPGCCEVSTHAFAAVPIAFAQVARSETGRFDRERARFDLTAHNGDDTTALLSTHLEGPTLVGGLVHEDLTTDRIRAGGRRRGLEAIGVGGQ